MDNLAKRAAVCKGWEWIPGMMVVGKIYDYSPAGTTEISSAMIITRVTDGVPIHNQERIRECLPVLDNPATMGCLLHIARKSWPLAPVTVASHWTWCPPERRDKRIWVCSYLDKDTYKQCSGSSEAECLIKVIEKAENNDE